MGLRTLHAGWSRAVEAIRGSLYAVPTALIVVALALAVGTLALDRSLGWDISGAWWPLGAGPDGTRSTLTSIAGSVMTVAGVSFSMTIVVLQLASTQYSPRVVRNFRRDRLIQTVFGVFSGTFVYALIVLRTIAASEDGPPFTAPISVTVAMLLGGASMVLLVVLVHHVARTVQVSSILHDLHEETSETMEHLYPERLAEARDGSLGESPPPWRDERAWELRSKHTGYVQTIDARGLEHLHGAELVAIAVRVGDFVRRGDVLARVWPCDCEPERGNSDALASFVIGRDRTLQQDAAYGFRLIADIALRALSPGVNDPTTAIQCVERAGALLCELVERAMPDPLRRTEDGTAIYAPRPSFAEIVELAFAQIVAASDRSARVLTTVTDALAAIAERDRAGRHRGALAQMLSRIRQVTRSAVWPDEDRERVRACIRRVEQLVARSGEPDRTDGSGARAAPHGEAARHSARSR